MDRLPVEQFVSIVLLLTKSERARQTLVCKKWYSIIRDHCLYNELKINSIDRFNRAIETIDNNPHLGQQVKTLAVDNCRLDAYYILLLPRYFPNLQELEWSEEDKSWEERQLKRRAITSLPSTQFYQRELQKWKKIQFIRVTLERLPFVTLILKSSILTSLTKLSVSFQRLHLDQHYGVATMQRVIPIVKELIKHLQYVPALKYLHFEKPVLGLNDMENIHINLPNLRELQLNFVCMSFDCNARTFPFKNITCGDPATGVEKIDFTFYVNSFSTLHTLQRSKKTLTNWLTYISSKYTKLQDMVLELSNYDGVPVINDFKKPIIQIIRNTSALSYYSGQLYPITPEIMEAIDSSQGKVKEMYMFADKNEEMETQVDYISNSTQAKTLSVLTLYAWDLDINESTTSPLSVVLTKLSLEFLNLGHLHLDFIVHYNNIVEILKILPSLETLTLHAIKIGKEDTIGLNVISKCNIKCLDIEINCDASVEMDRVNHVLMFLLQSCPTLEEFRVTGDFSLRTCGIARLHFAHHVQLREVHVSIKGVQYYTFSWEEGKQGTTWADYDRCLESTTNTENSFHIDIAWKNKRAKFDLRKAPVA
ncbi:hypothetical protein EDC94DRAFT_602808 [Helicostylum pulchrum]|nr:hypothetical protein EDC94DRAFT_602808 [Helicostylum pulchrum]